MSPRRTKQNAYRMIDGIRVANPLLAIERLDAALAVELCEALYSTKEGREAIERDRAEFRRLSAHAVRSLDLQMFNGFDNPTIWYGPWTNTMGNVLLFMPLGASLVALGRAESARPGSSRSSVSSILDLIPAKFTPSSCERA